MACRATTKALPDLTRERIEGVTAIANRPRSGWRDAVALLATAFSLLGAGAAGLLVTHHSAGLLLAPVVGLFGYTKQFWRVAFKRRPRLETVAAPIAPDGLALEGIAQTFDRTVGSKQLAIATTFVLGGGVIARAIEAVPFWLVLPDRRVLVTGPCWLVGVSNQTSGGDPVAAVLAELGAVELPLTPKYLNRLVVKRVAIAEGDRVSVIGRLQDQQIAGSGGYRDSLVETVTGEPGTIVWIEQIEAN